MRQRLETHLYHFNKWLLPAITAFLFPFVLWINKAVHENSQDHLAMVQVIEKSDAKLRAEIDAKIASQPPPEWKARIIALETSSIARGEQMARFEIMLIDVRERVIRLDEDRKKTATN